MVYCRVKLVARLCDNAVVVEERPSPREVVREAVALPRAAKDEPRENPPVEVVPPAVEVPELGAALE